MHAWLIGIDDTDMPDTRGTGHLARALAEGLAAQGFVSAGITRHQLLVHPEIRYTSHNSANCLEVAASEDHGAALFAWACDFVGAQAAHGADPGVCVARKALVGEGARGFGLRAQAEVLAIVGARRVAASEGHLLAGLAGTEAGVIGALAAVGLRAGGEDGRFIGLGAIRELPARARVRDILDAGVAALEAPGGAEPQPGDWVETFGWVRPRLRGGRPVLLVQRSDQDGVDWVVCDRRAGPDKGAASA
ncbi:MAG: ABC transporter substrate-binding protein [Planctomycetes bacterium]|nr:ABC transporter substrate-binding protein [Planctomycetota bacterium]